MFSPITSKVFNLWFHHLINLCLCLYIFAAMKRLQDKGASYFVMDLRDNLGGLVQAGIETAKLFLDEGDTVNHRIALLQLREEIR